MTPARASSFDPALAARLRADRQLLAQLEKIGARKGLMTLHSQKPWASATFAGTRHTLAWRFDGREACEHGETLIALLPDHEFTLDRHLVAEAAVTEVRSAPGWDPILEVTAEILLLEEC